MARPDHQRSISPNLYEESCRATASSTRLPPVPPGLSLKKPDGRALGWLAAVTSVSWGEEGRTNCLEREGAVACGAQDTGTILRADLQHGRRYRGYGSIRAGSVPDGRL